MYNLLRTTDLTGITEMGEFDVPPAIIVKRFGPPGAGDGYKISGQYVFVDTNGEPFVVHDWKSTTLWDGGLGTPEDFWASEEPQEMTVSTRDLDTEVFVAWFLRELEEES
jgi:hypothetical protein